MFIEKKVPKFIFALCSQVALNSPDRLNMPIFMFRPTNFFCLTICHPKLQFGEKNGKIKIALFCRVLQLSCLLMKRVN